MQALMSVRTHQEDVDQEVSVAAALQEHTDRWQDDRETVKQQVRPRWTGRHEEQLRT